MILKLLNLKKNNSSSVFKFDELELSKFNILIGKNGSGKTAIVKGIYQNSLVPDKYIPGTKNVNGHYIECSENLDVLYDGETLLMPFSAREDNGKYRGYFGKDMRTDISSLFSSEGQSIKISFGSYIKSVGQTMRKNPGLSGCMLIDELESGLSPNVIHEAMKALCMIDGVEKGMQIIVTSNNYQTIHTLNRAKNLEFSVIDVSQGKRINSPLTYDDFYSIYK